MNARLELTPEEIEAAFERAEALRLLDEPDPLAMQRAWAPNFTADEWRAKQRRDAFLDNLILWASITLICGLILAIGFGVMR